MANHEPKEPLLGSMLRPGRAPRVERTCAECGREFLESQCHPQDERLLCPRCRREEDQE